MTSNDVVTLELHDASLRMRRYEAGFVLRGEEMVRAPRDQWQLAEDKMLPIGETGFTADLLDVPTTSERVLRLTAPADQEIRWGGASSQPSTSRCAFFTARASDRGGDAKLQGLLIKSGGPRFDPASAPYSICATRLASPAEFIATDLRPGLRPVMAMPGRPDSFGSRGAHEPPSSLSAPSPGSSGASSSRSPLTARIHSMRGGA